MALAERSIRWVDAHLAQVLGGQLAILAVFASAATLAPPVVTLTLWVAASGLLLPGLANIVRRASSQRAG
jgi:hypothetical protein